MRVFCHRWCLTAHNFTNSVQLHSHFTASAARLWCCKANTSVFVFCWCRSGSHGVTNALPQYITRSALQYKEAQMCPWLTIKCWINRLCVCVSPSSLLLPFRQEWWITLRREQWLLQEPSSSRREATAACYSFPTDRNTIWAKQRVFGGDVGASRQLHRSLVCLRDLSDWSRFLGGSAHQETHEKWSSGTCCIGISFIYYFFGKGKERKRGHGLHAD